MIAFEKPNFFIMNITEKIIQSTYMLHYGKSVPWIIFCHG